MRAVVKGEVVSPVNSTFSNVPHKEKRMDKSTIQLVNEFYEDEMFGPEARRFDMLGFCNVGYWKGCRSESVAVAQISLIETLIDFFHKQRWNNLGCSVRPWRINQISSEILPTTQYYRNQYLRKAAADL